MKFFLWFRSITRPLFLFGIALVLFGLLFSKLLISIGSFTILGTWIIDWDMKRKAQSFIKNPVAIGFSLLFLIHIFGLLYTDNIDYAFKDIRIKLPLLLFPLVFSTSKKLSIREMDFFKLFFILLTLISTFISTYYYLWGGDFYTTNSRNISIFISHIRLSLIICLAILACYELFGRYKQTTSRYSMLLCIVWFMGFLIAANYITGLVILFSALFFLLLRSLFIGRRKKFLLGFTIIFIAFFGLVGYKIHLLHLEFIQNQSIKDIPFEQVSLGGEQYVHPDLYYDQPHLQNGYMVYKNIAREEFKRTWNQRSDIDFEGKTIHGYPIKDVALWYLTSKGMKKDSVAVMSLSDKEINAIENGIANVNYINRNGLEVRLLQTFWEFHNYLNGGDYNGHSVVMRLVFWKAAVQIFSENWLIGTGTGDIDDAFTAHYESTNSLLKEKWRLRSHNQYLTFLATFGALGFIVVIYSLIVPFLFGKTKYLYIGFMAIVLISMINEDTLETQVGATFFAFFNSFLYFLDKRIE